MLGLRDFEKGGLSEILRQAFCFHFGGAETGSIADKDRFAECPWGIGRR